MSREAYLAARNQKNPRYERDRAVARVQLNIAAALYQRRDRLGYTLEQIEERTGISVKRLEMIEEGDTSSLPEVLILADDLGLALMVDGISAVEARPKGELRLLLDKQGTTQPADKRSIA
jgi:transcriptional regulator with XRE-family HTH domain